MVMRCYRKKLRGSPCQDPAGNRTQRRSPDHRITTQTAVVWSCLPFIRSGQNHLVGHSKRGKKTRQTEEEVGRHQGMDRPGVRQVTEDSGEQGKMEETGSEIICGAPTTFAVKEYMMMMMTSFNHKLTAERYCSTSGSCVRMAKPPTHSILASHLWDTCFSFSIPL